jgi:hypothetical protein
MIFICSIPSILYAPSFTLTQTLRRILKRASNVKTLVVTRVTPALNSYGLHLLVLHRRSSMSKAAKIAASETTCYESVSGKDRALETLKTAGLVPGDSRGSRSWFSRAASRDSFVTVFDNVPKIQPL